LSVAVKRGHLPVVQELVAHSKTLRRQNHQKLLDLCVAMNRMDMWQTISNRQTDQSASINGILSPSFTVARATHLISIPCHNIPGLFELACDPYDPPRRARHSISSDSDYCYSCHELDATNGSFQLRYPNIVNTCFSNPYLLRRWYSESNPLGSIPEWLRWIVGNGPGSQTKLDMVIRDDRVRRKGLSFRELDMVIGDDRVRRKGLPSRETLLSTRPNVGLAIPLRPELSGHKALSLDPRLNMQKEFHQHSESEAVAESEDIIQEATSARVRDRDGAGLQPALRVRRFTLPR